MPTPPPAQPPPRAELPFTLVGAAAGWVAADVFRNPLFRWALYDLRAGAALTGALAGGLIGYLLTRAIRAEASDALRAPLDDGDQLPPPPPRVGLRLALAMPAGGALAALLLMVAVPRAAALSTLGMGILGGLAAWPLCWLVLLAARSAVRARHGSIVASSDRRSVWVYTWTSIAALAALTAIDWPAVRIQLSTAPLAAIALGSLAGVALLALTLADAAALLRVRREAPTLEERTEQRHADTGEKVPRLDYGLGDDVRAEIGAAANAYRSRGRVTRFVLGDPGEALTALRRALLRDLALVGVAALALAAHPAGRSLTAAKMFHGDRCIAGSRWDCRELDNLNEQEVWEQREATAAAYGLPMPP